MKKKKSSHFKITFIFITIIAFSFIAYYYMEYKAIKKIIDKLEQENADIYNYYIYGTHFNIEGTLSDIEYISDIDNIKLVFVNKSGQELEYNCEYDIKDKKINIKTSSYINKGINLEDINNGKYYVFLKTEYDNNNKYYSFNNKTSYENLKYYTITKNKSNRKIDINFKEYNSKIPLMQILSNTAELPKETYDISIDPGHGGSDPGAVSGNYKEAEIAMEYSLLLKKELEDLGLKVILTRDGTEDTSKNSKFNAYSVYDHNGRVNIVGRSKAKYNLSIHLNSLDINTVSGTEIYAPTRADLYIAQSFADNIVKVAKTQYSTREIDKVSNGVYVRNFTEEQIQSSAKEAKEKGYLPYNITTSTPYLYMIREVGGKITNAYVDGRNKSYGVNEYYNSNIGIESYLIELGYINNKNDLKNLLNNKELYVEAIKKTVQEYICNL